MKKSIIVFIGILILFTAGVSSLHSHPHMFIDTRVTFDFTEEQLTGFWIDWTFDRLFTEMIIVDYRLERGRDFSNAQVAEIKEGAFSNLRHFDYFTYVIYNGKQYPAQEVREFSAFMRDNRLVYSFFVPFEAPVSRSRQEIKVRIYDHTFFCDIAYVRDEPVAFSAPGSVRRSYDIRRNPNEEIEYEAENATVTRQNVDYTGFANPYELILEFQKR